RITVPRAHRNSLCTPPDGLRGAAGGGAAGLADAPHRRPGEDRTMAAGRPRRPGGNRAHQHLPGLAGGRGGAPYRRRDGPGGPPPHAKLQEWRGRSSGSDADHAFPRPACALTSGRDDRSRSVGSPLAGSHRRTARHIEATGTAIVYVTELSSQSFSRTVRQYVQLTKPRVVMLSVFCAVIGMFLATDGMVPLQVLLAGTGGITLLAASGFVLNCLIERHTD